MKNEIYPCLWFNQQAKEAAEFYTSVFEEAEITSESPMVVTFVAGGRKFMCLNGGSEFNVNPSVSFFVLCESELEIDQYWKKLLKGGKALMDIGKYEWSEKYGWVQDKFGVTWQLSFGKFADAGQKFTPVLMFTREKSGKAEEAINYYTSLFDNSGIRGILKYKQDEDDVEGYVKHAQFNLGNNVFMAMDSSAEHAFGFNEAVSFVVECDTQEEIDYFWNKLTKEGKESVCGWLKDKYGLSWQIIPAILERLMKDPEKSQKVVDAFMQMRKMEIDKLLIAAGETAIV